MDLTGKWSTGYYTYSSPPEASKGAEWQSPHHSVRCGCAAARRGGTSRRHVAAAIWAVALTRVVFGWVMS